MSRGFSLTEVIVAAAVFALAIPLLLNLLPTSFLSLRKAEALQACTSLALYRMDEADFLPPVAGINLDERIQVGRRSYRLVREFYRVDSSRLDVVVSCQCDSYPPVLLATRLIKEAP